MTTELLAEVERIALQDTGKASMQMNFDNDKDASAYLSEVICGLERASYIFKLTSVRSDEKDASRVILPIIDHLDSAISILKLVKF